MHLPSARVYREMRSEEVSLWFVPANDRTEIALLIKAPTSSIKALITGCPMQLLFSKSNNILCHGVRIVDTPDAPLIISGTQIHKEEHEALMRFANEGRIPLFLFNELSVCLASADLKISENVAAQIRDMIGNVDELYIGAFNAECSQILDSFCYSTDDSQEYSGASKLPLLEIPVDITAWKINQISFLGNHESHTINIDNPDEGAMLEKAIWASLDSVFPLTLHKSPQVKIGDKERELIDVIAFHEYGNFLIEAKDLSVLQAGFERSQERRTKGTQKQVVKAIRQLVGAAKAIQARSKIFTNNGLELEVVSGKPDHCIILISELMHFGDWVEIERLLIEAMIETKCYFHLLDLREFITLLKVSSGNAMRLDVNLMNRCERFIKVQSVHIRSRVGVKDTDNDEASKIKK